LGFSLRGPYGKLNVMTSKLDITIEHLRESLDYNAQTGIFTWRKNHRRPDLIGKTAGSVHSAGYISIAIHNVKRLAHRLAWFYVTGKMPEGHIDHINGNKLDNSFTNLRQVTRFGNLQNMRKATKANKSGFLGVCSHQGKWLVQIMANGERIRESGFNTPEEAHQRYLELKRLHHFTCTI
jgi:hypothetical protein